MLAFFPLDQTAECDSVSALEKKRATKLLLSPSEHERLGLL